MAQHTTRHRVTGTVNRAYYGRTARKTDARRLCVEVLDDRGRLFRGHAPQSLARLNLWEGDIVGARVTFTAMTYAWSTHWTFETPSAGRVL